MALWPGSSSTAAAKPGVRRSRNTCLRRGRRHGLPCKHGSPRSISRTERSPKPALRRAANRQSRRRTPRWQRSSWRGWQRRPAARPPPVLPGRDRGQRHPSRQHIVHPRTDPQHFARHHGDHRRQRGQGGTDRAREQHHAEDRGAVPNQRIVRRRGTELVARPNGSEPKQHGERRQRGNEERHHHQDCAKYDAENQLCRLLVTLASEPESFITPAPRP